MDGQTFTILISMLMVAGSLYLVIISELPGVKYERQRKQGIKQIQTITGQLESMSQKYGGRNIGSSMMAGKVQASLQFAFYGALTKMLYEWNDGSVSGIFEVSDNKTNRVALFSTAHMRILSHLSPHLYIDNTANNSWLKKNLPEKMENAKLKYLDGFISDRYDVYAPPGYQLDALVIGAPDVLDAIDRNNLGADIEVLGDQFYMIFPEIVDLPTKLAEILPAAKAIADAFDDNLSRYIDDRARGTDQSVAPEGLRLIRK